VECLLEVSQCRVREGVLARGVRMRAYGDERDAFGVRTLGLAPGDVRRRCEVREGEC
jgi:hypothetical protein